MPKARVRLESSFTVCAPGTVFTGGIVAGIVRTEIQGHLGVRCGVTVAVISVPGKPGTAGPVGVGIESQEGDFVLGRDDFERALRLYDPQRHAHLTSLVGAEVGVIGGAGVAACLSALGYPDQALALRKEAITRAEELAHAPSLGLALVITDLTMGPFYLGALNIQHTVVTLLGLAGQEDLKAYQAWGMIFLGMAQMEQGAVQAGIDSVRQGVAAHQRTQAGHLLALVMLAEMYRRAGQAQEGLQVLEEAMPLTTPLSVGILHMLRGELLSLQHAPPGELENLFLQAIHTARRQQTKTLELRAAVDLARLWQHQGKPSEARLLLAEIYAWFSEGFDLPDLQQARNLLGELSADD